MSLCLFLAVIALAVVPEVQIGTLDGEQLSGRLLELSPEKAVAKTADGQETTLAADRLLYISPRSAPTPATNDKSSVWLELVDGSTLVANRFAVQKGSATIGLSNEDIELPTRFIAKVRFSLPNESRAAWPTDVGSQATSDLLVTRTSKGVDFLEGVLGDITPEHANFQFQGETIPVKRAKVDGLVYFHKATDKLPDATCTMDDARGWQLKAKSVSLAEGQLEVTTLAGVALRVPWESISRLDFSAGKVVYLSDLDPESVQWTPYLDLGRAAPALVQFYAPRRNEGREQSSLRLGGKVYAKGLSLYSRTAIIYRLPTGIKKFKATVGIDDSVRDAGNVRLEISADGKKLLDQVVAGHDSPRELDLNLAGARRLSILVDYGDNQDAGDYLNLVDARMLK